jgi:hypothetical protein
MLVHELGVEPGAELRRLHQQILAHDPALAPLERDLVSVPEAAAEAPGPAGRRA